MSGTGNSEEARPITVGDLQNDLRTIASWLDTTGSVMGAVKPPDLILAPWPGQGSGTPIPPRAVPKCIVPPVPSVTQGTRASDVEAVLVVLRDWVVSVATTLDGLSPTTVVRVPESPSSQP
jgi:hypothetical protein